MATTKTIVTSSSDNINNNNDNGNNYDRNNGDQNNSSSNRNGKASLPTPANENPSGDLVAN